MGAKNSKKKKEKADGAAPEPEAEGEGFDEPVIFTQNHERVSIENFDLLCVIGKGSFGKVFQVKKKDTEQIFAMKVLRKEQIVERNQVEHTMSEKDILMKVQHPFIVSLKYAFQTEDKLYMVLDYINGGELFFHLKKEGRFPEDRVQLYSAEILLALAHLHSLGIIYRDLKPENILLDHNGHIRITDFGLSKTLTEESSSTHTFCGTPEYLAPEILNGKGHGKAVDWWSLGTLMFEMLTGLPPFYAQNVNVMYQKILNGELKFPPYMSEQAQSLLRGLLTRNVSERLGSGPTDGEELKSHAFFNGLDWAAVLKQDIVPAFKPEVSGAGDTTQIDPMFTQEAPQDTPVDRPLGKGPVDANFGGFTFVGESAIGK